MLDHALATCCSQTFINKQQERQLIRREHHRSSCLLLHTKDSSREIMREEAIVCSHPATETHEGKRWAPESLLRSRTREEADAGPRRSSREARGSERERGKGRGGRREAGRWQVQLPHPWTEGDCGCSSDPVLRCESSLATCDSSAALVPATSSRDPDRVNCSSC